MAYQLSFQGFKICFACFHLSMAMSKPRLELIKFITMLLHGMGQLVQ
jgi:hypothetical protein